MMRFLHAALGLFVTALVAAACSINKDNCDRNPECADYPGHKYISTGVTGGGGTGGSTCAVPADCPEPADKCKERTCEGGTCGLKDKSCGTLTCDSGSGQCVGCDDNDPQKECPPKDCHDIVCTNGTCVETPDGTLTCDGGNGTCDDGGNCGTCADGVQNGDETGVDCGTNTACGKCNGDPCSAINPGECKSDFCADGVCCDMACDGPCQACDQSEKVGACSALTAGAPDEDGFCGGMSEGGCGETLGYCRCNDGIQNGDETDVDCGGPTCAKCGTGHSCVDATGSDCISNNCVDGYCCGAPCTNPCRACNLPGLEGLCSSVDPGTKDACGGTQVCGVTACAEPIGTCSLPSDCASNNCSAQSLCSLACVMDTDCPDGQVCAKGACFDKATQGKPCLSANACQDGLTCVDGVCCDTACDGLCMGCAANYTAQPSGTCAPIQKGYDPHNECPQTDPPDPDAPGPGGSAYCSGAPADATGNSSCAQPSP